MYLGEIDDTTVMAEIANAFQINLANITEDVHGSVGIIVDYCGTFLGEVIKIYDKIRLSLAR